jgi:hypothetical protein
MPRVVILRPQLRIISILLLPLLLKAKSGVLCEVSNRRIVGSEPTDHGNYPSVRGNLRGDLSRGCM